MAKVSELLHWHHQKPLAHLLDICSLLPDPRSLLRMSSNLLGYLDQTHLGQSFWASRTSGPSSTACKIPIWGFCIMPPRGRRAKGQVCIMAFKVWLCSMGGPHEQWGEELNGQILQNTGDRGHMPQRAHCHQVQESRWCPETHPDSAPKGIQWKLWGNKASFSGPVGADLSPSLHSSKETSRG